MAETKKKAEPKNQLFLSLLNVPIKSGGNKFSVFCGYLVAEKSQHQHHSADIQGEESGCRAKKRGGFSSHNWPLKQVEQERLNSHTKQEKSIRQNGSASFQRQHRHNSSVTEPNRNENVEAKCKSSNVRIYCKARLRRVLYKSNCTDG